MASLKDKVIFITGATRGIGREIALHAAKEGAILIITGKTEQPHRILPGTIHTVANEVIAAGRQALPILLDVREDEQIHAAVDKVVERYGRIDVLINNASAIQLTRTEETPMRRFDLMYEVNVRATFACAQACIPFLKKAANPHILTLSPPLNLDPKWFRNHVAYTISKYGMSMCTLGWAEELAAYGIAVNSLWPRTTIDTSAMNHFPKAVRQASRHPDIMAEAAVCILKQPAKTLTGQFLIDEAVLASIGGVTDFSRYALNPEMALYDDLFL